MNTITQAVILSFLPFLLFSQVQISGIINDYGKVYSIDPCEAKLTVFNPSAFTQGAKVMLVQMKGATINTSNSGSFGNINEIGGAGLHELGEVKSVTGNDVYLKHELLNVYSTAGSLQLITVPFYDNALIVSTLTAKPWDGETGGVLIFEADNLQFSADIDVSGLGFRGAEKKLVVSDCTFWTNADEFHYNTSNWRGSPKGEGIADLASGKEHGRGAQANGGGGGNDHNSGGGGGGNVSEGGIGGKQSASGFGCDGDYPGRGGKPCPADQTRIYLGGGGGAGHFDDDGAGSSGGHGGGIAIIMASSITPNGFSIISNGVKPTLAFGDGAGGGGAGGTIVLTAANIQGPMKIEAKGGGGGDSSNVPERCNGVGGGGSGGRLLSNSVSGLLVNLEGGQPGVNLASSGQCSGQSNGAEEGEAGVEAALQALPQSTQEIIATNVIQQLTDPMGCVGVELGLSFLVEGNYLAYQWQQDYGNGWQNLQNNSIYSGVNSPDLIISSPAPAMDGTKYRCVVSNACNPDLSSDEVTLELVGATESNFTVSTLGNGNYQFQSASLNATSLLWEFGDGTTSNEENPLHTYADFGNFTVTLTATGPCGDDVFSSTILVAVLPTAGFSFTNTGNCAPQNVQFANQSSANAIGYQWYFPGGVPAYSTATAPLVSYSTQGIFDVILIATNAVGSDTLALVGAIEVGGTPMVDFEFNVSNLSVSFFNQSLNASNGYLWDFGDGTTSTDPQPVHQYAMQGNYFVTLTAFNDCGESTISLDVPTGALPLAVFNASTVAGCSPMLVQFENQSTGGNNLSYQWEFPGGQPSTASEPNPTVAYINAGIYNVKLTVTNPLGSHAIERLNYLQVDQSPLADFTYQIDGYTVTFTNASTGGTQFTWDFGDGNTSQTQNPSYNYAGPGVYDVMLTATSSNCGSAIAYSVFLQPLGTAEENLAGHVSIFPNPTSDWINIGFGNLAGDVEAICLRNSVGSILRSIPLQGDDSYRLNLAAVPDGIYYLQVQLGNGLLLSKRFIKQ
ncbi:MAG: PKD domain-containing protein [Saprospiraceae bacterium]|nr:PKD domain-containing protein [Saprospiraceae bacterium]